MSGSGQQIWMAGPAYECPEMRLLRWTPGAGDKGVSPFTPATRTLLFSYLDAQDEIGLVVLAVKCSVANSKLTYLYILQLTRGDKRCPSGSTLCRHPSHCFLFSTCLRGRKNHSSLQFIHMRLPFPICSQ